MSGSGGRQLDGSTFPSQMGNPSLGIPTWTDKMLQEVIRMILEAFFWLDRHSGDHLELNTWYQRYL